MPPPNAIKYLSPAPAHLLDNSTPYQEWPDATWPVALAFSQEKNAYGAWPVS
jgi:hypothetical protein